MAAMQQTGNTFGQGFSRNALQGIMEGASDSMRGGFEAMANASMSVDDFDPERLLNQPLYEDSHNSLNFSKTSFSGMMTSMDGSPTRDARVVEDLSIKIPEPDPLPIKTQSMSAGTNLFFQQAQQQNQQLGITISNDQSDSYSINQLQSFSPSSQINSGGAQQQNLQLQQQQQRQQQAGHMMMSPAQNGVNGFPMQQQQQQQQFGGPPSPTRDEVEQRVHEINEQLRQVQEQIQQVQFQSSQLENENIMQQHSQLPMQQQQQNIHQPQQQNAFNLMSQNNNCGNEGFTRQAPGRSVSMPLPGVARPDTAASNFIIPQFKVHQTGAVSNIPVTISPMNGMVPGGFGPRPMDDNSMRSNASSHAVPNHISSQQYQTSPLNNHGRLSGSPLTVSTQQSNQVESMDLPQSSSDSVSTSGTNQPSPVNEAMEKLCESMRRSAMSRSMVKQLSGRHLTPQNSGRNLLAKQGSTRTLGRQNSARGSGLMRQNSGLHRQKSGRNLVRANSGLGMEGSVPVRRPSQDPKHRFTPNRGIYRHKSQSAIMGLRSNNNTPQNLSVLQNTSQINNVNNGLNESLHGAMGSGGSSTSQHDDNASGMF